MSGKTLAAGGIARPAASALRLTTHDLRLQDALVPELNPHRSALINEATVERRTGLIHGIDLPDLVARQRHAVEIQDLITRED